MTCVPGLTLGCVIASLANMVISLGALGLLDVVFGSLATALGALVYLEEQEKTLPLLGPVLANAVIVCISSILLVGILHIPFYHLH